jgi:hypothetical protein
MLPYMMSKIETVSYQTVEGSAWNLTQMDKRTKIIPNGFTSN